MEIKTKSYSIWYDSSNHTIYLQGSLRLSGSEDYDPIAQLLDRIVELEPSFINIDLKELEFLNSSGINILSKFVINVRKKKNIRMSVIGSKEVAWQSKSLKNLQRLMPSLDLQLV
jgi:hypothetical protein